MSSNNTNTGRGRGNNAAPSSSSARRAGRGRGGPLSPPSPPPGPSVAVPSDADVFADAHNRVLRPSDATLATRAIAPDPSLILNITYTTTDRASIHAKQRVIAAKEGPGRRSTPGGFLYDVALECESLSAMAAVAESLERGAKGLVLATPASTPRPRLDEHAFYAFPRGGFGACGSHPRGWARWMLSELSRLREERVVVACAVGSCVCSTSTAHTGCSCRHNTTATHMVPIHGAVVHNATGEQRLLVRGAPQEDIAFLGAWALPAVRGRTRVRLTARIADPALSPSMPYALSLGALRASHFNPEVRWDEPTTTATTMTMQGLVSCAVEAFCLRVDDGVYAEYCAVDVNATADVADTVDMAAEVATAATASYPTADDATRGAYVQRLTALATRFLRRVHPRRVEWHQFGWDATITRDMVRRAAVACLSNGADPKAVWTATATPWALLRFLDESTDDGDLGPQVHPDRVPTFAPIASVNLLSGSEAGDADIRVDDAGGGSTTVAAMQGLRMPDGVAPPGQTPVDTTVGSAPTSGAGALVLATNTSLTAVGAVGDVGASGGTIGSDADDSDNNNNGAADGSTHAAV